MRHHARGVVFLIGTGICLASGAVVAEVPQLINYQGRLTDTDGTPLVGEHAVTFRIYDAESGGSQLWEEAHQIRLASDDNGIISVVLGSLKPFGTLDFTKAMWLSVQVDTDAEMAPRQRLTAVGYAINADTLDGLNHTQLLRADVDTVATGQLKLTRPTLPLVIQPSADPAANTKLLDVLNAAGGSTFSIDLEGDATLTSVDFGPGISDDLIASDVATLTGGPTSIADSLHSHAASVPPDLFDDVLPADVAQTAAAGTLTKAARRDHVHRGMHSLAVSGQPQLFGDVTLASGDNITLTQAGQTITIAGEEAGEFARVSTSASSSLAVGTTDTTLLSVTVTKANPNSALLIIASVALSHSSGGGKTVDVKLRRDGTLLDAAYTSRIGGGGGNVRNDVVTIHAWDPTTAGSHTIDFQASASSTGASATVRRLTVIELL